MNLRLAKSKELKSTKWLKKEGFGYNEQKGPHKLCLFSKKADLFKLSRWLPHSERRSHPKLQSHTTYNYNYCFDRQRCGLLPLDAISRYRWAKVMMWTVMKRHLHLTVVSISSYAWNFGRCGTSETFYNTTNAILLGIIRQFALLYLGDTAVCKKILQKQISHVHPVFWHCTARAPHLE